MGDDWRPISTAPRSRTPDRLLIEVMHDSDPVQVTRVYWDPFVYNKHIDEQGAWVEQTGEFVWYEGPDLGPTHWRTVKNPERTEQEDERNP